MTEASGLDEYFGACLPEALELLRSLVELESHSLDKAGVDRLAVWLTDELRLRRASVERLEDQERGPCLRGGWPGEGAPVLLLGHLDTVWPPGTTKNRPFVVENGRAKGPGVFDMKGGLLLCLLVGGAVGRGRLAPGKPVEFLFTSDEEIGTESGLPHVRAAAAGARAVLCLEPPLPGGAAKTRRSGVSVYHLSVEGIAAHAGLDHAKGANAVLELSRHVIELGSMTDYTRRLTVNIGRISGGVASNVVPAFAEAEVDVRFGTVEEGEEMDQTLRGLRAFDPRCRLRVEGGVNRPPLERTAAVGRLFALAREAAREAGFDLAEGHSGGGSDGSFTAAMGVPTLDGLGPDGDGAHALGEHILVSDIAPRAAFLSRLIQKI